MKINWGYAYIIAESSSGLSSTFGPWNTVTQSFIKGQPFPPDDTNKPRKCSGTSTQC